MPTRDASEPYADIDIALKELKEFVDEDASALQFVPQSRPQREDLRAEMSQALYDVINQHMTHQREYQRVTQLESSRLQTKLLQLREKRKQSRTQSSEEKVVKSEFV